MRTDCAKHNAIVTPEKALWHLRRKQERTNCTIPQCLHMHVPSLSNKYCIYSYRQNWMASTEVRGRSPRLVSNAARSGWLHRPSCCKTDESPDGARRPRYSVSQGILHRVRLHGFGKVLLPRCLAMVSLKAHLRHIHKLHVLHTKSSVSNHTKTETSAALRAPHFSVQASRE